MYNQFKKKIFRPIIFILLQLLNQYCLANMASPIHKGTLSSAAFSSRDIDILNEKMLITIDKDFKSASYNIEYHIKTGTEGKQIPLLFHAEDYKGDFKVWVDDIEVEISNVPEEYRRAANSPFERFSNSFNLPSNENDDETTTIYWTEKNGTVYKLKDLKYFETALTKGEHTIRVEYTADVWVNRAPWVKEYSFRYALSPAHYWKSFGGLEIRIDASKSGKTFTTNIDKYHQESHDSMAVWKFKTLPDNYLEIHYHPEISSYAKTLLAIGPIRLTAGFAGILLLLHALSIFGFRKKFPLKKYSWVVITGGLLLPFLALLFYIFSFNFVDNAIGDDAGRYHGYTFLVIVLYPIIMPVYWIIMWLLDKMIKNKISNH